MRLFEFEQQLTEAVTPDDNAVSYTFKNGVGDILDFFIIVGGRIINNIPSSNKMNSFNLKNVRAPSIKTKALVNRKPVVAYHGSLEKFAQFTGNVWLATDIQLALFHAQFMAGAYAVKDKYIYVTVIQSDDLYVMGTEAKNGEVMNVTSESPGGEDLVKLHYIFKMGYDTIQWKDSFDIETGVTGNIYYTDQPHRIKILKRIPVLDHESSDAKEYEQTMKKYNRPISKEGEEFIKNSIDGVDDVHITVIEPGQTAWDVGEHMSLSEYLGAKEHGIKIKLERVKYYPGNSKYKNNEYEIISTEYPAVINSSNLGNEETTLIVVSPGRSTFKVNDQITNNQFIKNKKLGLLVTDKK